VGGPAGYQACIGPTEDKRQATPWTKWNFDREKDELDRSRVICDDEICSNPWQEIQNSSCSGIHYES